jgi:hypothetical protein
MKKIAMLALMLLIGSSACGRSDWADKLMGLSKTANDHKAAWFDLKKEYNDKMIDLLNRIHAEWTDLHNQAIMDWKNAQDCSSTAKDKIFEEQYTKAIKLHKSHCDAWKSLYENHDKKVKALAQKQSQDMQDMDVVQMIPTYIR